MDLGGAVKGFGSLPMHFWSSTASQIFSYPLFGLTRKCGAGKKRSPNKFKAGTAERHALARKLEPFTEHVF